MSEKIPSASNFKFRTQPWRKLDDKLISSARVFELRSQLMLSPENNHKDDFYYLSSKDWVNIIPITSDGKVVMVEQYRHGINAQSLETPGGIIDIGETPEKTALRELGEETGYVTEELEFLGTLSPNPAILNNMCHIFLAKNVRKELAQNLDPAEDIKVHLIELSQIPEFIFRRIICHMIVSTAFYLYQNRACKT